MLANSARFPPLGEQAFGEIQALLDLVQFVPDAAHFAFKRVEPTLAVGPPGSPSQPLEWPSFSLMPAEA